MEYSRQTNNLIAALRGLPEDHNVSRLRPAFALGSLIEVLEQRYKIGQERVEATIAKHWKEIVGEHAAHRTCPQKVVAGGAVLMIQVTSPVLRSEMQFKQREILDRIHRLPGGSAIRELHFRAG